MTHTVLFVDDEANIRKALERLFADDPEISVVTADSAMDGMRKLSSRPISLVISDVAMPETDGVEFLTKVRKLYPDIPQMLLSGYGSSLGPEVFDRLGKVPVIDKPWDSDHLRDVVLMNLAQEILDDEERALVDLGKVTLKQIKRANRIRAKMQRPPALGAVLVQMGVLQEAEYERINRKRRTQMSLVDLLAEDGFLSNEDREKFVAARQMSPTLSDRQILVSGGMVTDEQFVRCLSAKYDIPYVEPDVGAIDGALLAKTSIRYLQRHRAIPVRVQNGKLEMIFADPLNEQERQEFERLFKRKIRPLCCTGDKIAEALRTLERLETDEDGTPQVALQYREIDAEQTEDMGAEAVQMVDHLLMRAIQIGASDLHIEPQQSKIRVRVRVDGVLRPLTDLPLALASRLISRVKILAGADISEKRLHQDGKIFVKVEGAEVDIRVSSYASIFGETLVLRLLDRNRNLVTLDAIGFQPRIRSVIDEVILKASSGLVLVTGPTGSGKTTTLYSFVEKAMDPAEKVITCEDPVEYVLEGIVQCSVNEKTGPTFADSLRAIVRQDPDTIIVGEIRDRVTAGLAVESALTGHKVYSTFHTEDAVSVVVRLLDMGVEPFLVSSTLSAVIAQRLVRRLCEQCKVTGSPKRSDLRFLGIDKSELRGVKVYDAKGCAECDGTGYRGRLGIHEVLIPDDDLRDAVVRRASAKELRKLARNIPDFLTLQEDALLKVIEGLTTLEEVVGNAPRDLDARPLATLRGIAGLGGKNRS